RDISTNNAITSCCKLFLPCSEINILSKLNPFCRPRHGCSPPCSCRLHPNHPCGGNRGQQVPTTTCEAVPRLQDQVPLAHPSPEELPRQPVHYSRSSCSLLVNHRLVF